MKWYERLQPKEDALSRLKQFPYTCGDCHVHLKVQRCKDDYDFQSYSSVTPVRCKACSSDYNHYQKKKRYVAKLDAAQGKLQFLTLTRPPRSFPTKEERDADWKTQIKTIRGIVREVLPRYEQINPAFKVYGTITVGEGAFKDPQTEVKDKKTGEVLRITNGYEHHPHLHVIVDFSHSRMDYHTLKMLFEKYDLVPFVKPLSSYKSQYYVKYVKWCNENDIQPMSKYKKAVEYLLKYCLKDKSLDGFKTTSCTGSLRTQPPVKQEEPEVIVGQTAKRDYYLIYDYVISMSYYVVYGIEEFSLTNSPPRQLYLPDCYAKSFIDYWL